MFAIQKIRDQSGVVYREMQNPQTDKDSVLLHVRYCGICGSDRHIYDWLPDYRWAEPYLPAVLGHEVLATVASIPLGSNYSLGDRVVVNPGIVCGLCPECRTGRQNLCSNRKKIGLHVPGGMADQMLVPLSNLHLVPTGVADDSAVLAEPLAVVAHGLSQLRQPIRGRAMVIGAGAVGLLAAEVLVGLGSQVTLIGLPRDQKNGAFDISRRLGAEALVVDDLEDAVWKASQSIVVNAAGGDSSMNVAISAVSPGGQILMLALGSGQYSMTWDSLVRREVQVVGSFAHTPTDFVTALAWMESGLALGAGIVSHKFPLCRASEAFGALAKGSARKVLVYPGATASSRNEPVSGTSSQPIARIGVEL